MSLCGPCTGESQWGGGLAVGFRSALPETNIVYRQAAFSILTWPNRFSSEDSEVSDISDLTFLTFLSLAMISWLQHFLHSRHMMI